MSPSGSKVAAVAIPVTSTEAKTLLPDTSTVPLISIAVAVRSISSVAPRERTVALEPWINWLASLN